MTQEAYVAVDVETAAQQAGSICQIGAAVFDADGDPVAGRRREMLVRPPDNLYGPEFSEYHGVKASDTKGAPPWETVAAEIAELIGGLLVVSHNAAYESEQFAAAGTPAQLLDASLYCSLRLSRYTDPGEGKHSLEECARRYGLRRTGKKTGPFRRFAFRTAVGGVGFQTRMDDSRLLFQDGRPARRCGFLGMVAGESAAHRPPG